MKIKRIGAAVLGICLICIMGLGDRPAAADEMPEPVRIIKYVPAQTEKIPEEEPADDAIQMTEAEPLGEFTITAYCACEKCCGQWSNVDRPLTASGDPAEEGITVGADWGLLPAGSVIYIDGLGERIVQDKPADWIVERYSGRILDVYFESHEAALAFGKQKMYIWRLS